MGLAEGTNRASIEQVFPFLKNADQEFVDEFLEQAHRVSLKKGEFIFLEGNQCAHIPLVLRGSARVYKVGDGAREITLYRIVRGEIQISIRPELVVITGCPIHSSGHFAVANSLITIGSSI